MFDEVNSFKAEEDDYCPICGIFLKKGETMYRDEYRRETLCHHCIDTYKRTVIQEEGIDGRKLK